MRVAHTKAMESSLHRRNSRGSVASTLPPEYELGDGTELAKLTPLSSRSAESLPPDYDDSLKAASSSSADGFPKARGVAAFRPSKAFQIQADGQPLIAIPLPPKNVPIPVYAVSPGTNSIGDLVYTSIRESRRSGTCTLVRAHDSSEEPLCTTTYRFGCNRPPHMQLANADTFEITSKGFTTRANIFRTHLGTYEWRYGNRQERKVAGAHSLVVLERVVNVALGGGQQKELRTVVAMFVRNAEVRTPGSKDSTAGNGGRLLVNMDEFADSKGADEQFEVFVVASCICMMKKEVDRRRLHQAIVIAGGASGGGG